MVSNVSIANRAATKLGASRILDLSDDTQVARVLNSMFESVLNEELRRNLWKFAIKRDSLMALVQSPAWGYQYQYPLPSDYLAMVQVNEFRCRTLGATAPWSIEAGRILTNFSAPLKIRYISKVSNPANFDPLFNEVLACKLAVEACETLTQSNTKKQTLMQEYEFALSDACRRDSFELEPDILPDGSWLEAGHGTCGYAAGEPWKAYPSGV